MNVCLLEDIKKFNMDMLVKIGSFQIKQNVLNLKSTLPHCATYLNKYKFLFTVTLSTVMQQPVLYNYYYITDRKNAARLFPNVRKLSKCAKISHM